MNENSRLRSGLLMGAACIVVGLLGGLGGWAWQKHQAASGPASNLAAADRAAIEQVVREYILEHPEVLPEAIDNLRRKEDSRQLASIQDDVEKPFPGAILGNPNGKVVLVEFSDFACTYCRKSVEEVDALIAANPDLKVVIREFPILSPQSASAARMGLAAAEQGKYGDFHRAMFAAGRVDAQSIEGAAQRAGLDLARARKFLSDPKVDGELSRNMQFGKQLGFQGTPSWVIGDEIYAGAVGREQLSRAIEKARG